MPEPEPADTYALWFIEWDADTLFLSHEPCGHLFRIEQGAGSPLDLGSVARLRCSCPAATAAEAPAPVEADNDGEIDLSEYVRADCACGFEIVYTPEGWQHDANPWAWGDDHDADPDDPEVEALAAAWQRAYDDDLDAWIARKPSRP